jgi:hypothetical protein
MGLAVGAGALLVGGKKTKKFIQMISIDFIYLGLTAAAIALLKK